MVCAWMIDANMVVVEILKENQTFSFSGSMVEKEEESTLTWWNCCNVNKIVIKHFSLYIRIKDIPAMMKVIMTTKPLSVNHQFLTMSTSLVAKARALRQSNKVHELRQLIFPNWLVKPYPTQSVYLIKGGKSIFGGCLKMLLALMPSSIEVSKNTRMTARFIEQTTFSLTIPVILVFWPSGKINILFLAWTNQWSMTVRFRCSLLAWPCHDVTHRVLQLTEVVDAAWRHIGAFLRFRTSLDCGKQCSRGCWAGAHVQVRRASLNLFTNNTNRMPGVITVLLGNRPAPCYTAVA